LHSSVIESYFKKQAVISKNNDVVVENRVSDLIKFWGTE